MKKIFSRILLFILIITPCLVKAQSVNRFLKTGIGTGFLSVRDKGMSPLLYTGAGYFSSQAYVSVSEKKTNSLKLDLTYGRVKNKKFGILHNSRVEITYSHLRKVINNERLDLFIGGSLGFLGAYRYQPFFLNSAHNYEIIQSVEITTSANYVVPLYQKNIIFSGSINIPIISAVIRPAYASPLPNGFQTFSYEFTEAYWRSNEMMTLNRFIRINTCFSANYPIFERDLMSLSYSWDFYTIQTENPVIFAGHTVLLSFFIYLK
ncbi:MAG: hypothetical protein M3Q58_17070 [Bacteroidota bacterium]|nr:hypothetical protein [Bacteroidota bacterium]